MRFFSVGCATRHRHTTLAGCWWPMTWACHALHSTHSCSPDVLFTDVTGAWQLPFPLILTREREAQTDGLETDQKHKHSSKSPHTHAWGCPPVTSLMRQEVLNLDALSRLLKTKQVYYTDGTPAISLTHNNSWHLPSFSYVPSTVLRMLYVSQKRINNLLNWHSWK